MTTTTAAPPNPAPARHAGFRDLVRAEFLKIRTTNAWWLLGLGMLVFTALALLINLFQAHDALTFHPEQYGGSCDQFGNCHPPTGEELAAIRAQFDARFAAELVKQASNVYTSGQFFGLMFVMLLGVLMVTNEFHHQTATATFLTTPHRSYVIFSKLVAAIGAGGALCLATMLIDVAVGASFFSGWGLNASLGDWEVLRIMALNLLTYVIWTIIGIGLGVLIRSQIGATITATILYLPGTYLSILAIVGIHQLIDSDWVYKAAILLPTIASTTLTTGTVDIAEVHMPGRWTAFVVLLGWGLAAAGVGTLITRKRDIS
jgi:ABC-type transport system involved in multi-copper enzyme maturation permease subunit